MMGLHWNIPDSSWWCGCHTRQGARKMRRSRQNSDSFIQREPPPARTRGTLQKSHWNSSGSGEHYITGLRGKVINILEECDSFIYSHPPLKFKNFKNEKTHPFHLAFYKKKLAELPFKQTDENCSSWSFCSTFWTVTLHMTQSLHPKPAVDFEVNGSSLSPCRTALCTPWALAN